MMTILLLFLNFAKFGLLCFGGGYMLIPLFIAEFVGEDKLLSGERFANLVSVSQITPGPVGINAATFIGFIGGGFWGALAATVGLVFPTLFLAGMAVSVIRKAEANPVMQGALFGARLAALALICFAVTIFCKISVFTSGGFSISGLLISLTAFFCFFKTKISSTWVIIGSGVIGAIIVPLIG